MNPQEYHKRYRVYQELVDGELNSIAAGWEPTIGSAMAYSLFPGGKRVRPVLFLAAADAVGGNVEEALSFAAAIEMIHTYSLIHDDLPAMDNDTLRRGKPTNHMVYGEGMAILAGDGLLSQAFQTMSSAALRFLNYETALSAMEVIAKGCGVEGMVFGQTLDLQNETARVGLEELLTIHHLKTGALIRSAVVAGAIMGGGQREILESFSFYGQSVGLAFQIADDLLDESATAKEMGKTPHKDKEQGKVTFASLFSPGEAKLLCRKHITEACDAISPFDENGFLRQMANGIGERAR